MEDNSKTQAQLVTAREARRLEALRQRLAELEAAKVERKQAEEKIRFQARLLDAVGQAVIVTDLDGSIIYWNRFAEMLYGWSAQEVLSRNVLEVVSAKSARVQAAEVMDRLKAGETWSGELLVRRRDGAVFLAAVTDTPIVNEQGAWVGVIGVSTDITERKRAEAALQQHNRDLDLLNRVSQTLTATLDLRQVAKRVTQAVARTIGATGGSVWVWDQEQPGSLVCLSAAYPGLKHPLDNLRLAPGEGIAGWVARHGRSAVVPQASEDARFSPIIDAQVGFHTISVLAVPLRVRDRVIGVLEAVNKQNGEFDTHDCFLVETLAPSAAIAIENARLVKELRQQAAALQARNEELDAFAHTVAHDLKAPLSLVIGYAELSKDYSAASPDGELCRNLQLIARNARKMSSIVQDLLLLAEVRSVDVEREPLDMAGIVAEAQDRLAHMIEEYQAEIVAPDVSAWPAALGYAPWVEQVWVNYIRNAIKYGGHPPRVELGADPLSVPSASGGEEKGGHVRFWVRDNGSGIPPEAQARLFTPFTRLDQVRAKGHGLGLSIVRRIVEKLGGQVGVESQVGQESVFSFTLPGGNLQ